MYGGLGSAVAEVVVTAHPVRMRLLGVPGVFAPTGSTEFLLRALRADAGRHPRRGARAGAGLTGMSGKHILAIDQGTTNTKVLLFDARGDVVARASRPVEISFPQPGWVEQDATTLWHSVEEAVDECLREAGDRRIDAVGISNQRESVLVWDRATGRPARPGHRLAVPPHGALL